MGPLGYFIMRCVYLILPGVAANAAPVLVMKHFRKLAIPVDLGKKINGKRIFGNNKTIRGIIFGVIFSLIVSFVQFLLYNHPAFKSLSFIDYGLWLPFGLLAGLGVAFGDLVNSFVKRRLDMKPGKPFIPFDQLNSLFGAWLFVLPIYVPPMSVVLVLLVIAFFAHLGFNLLGYYIGLEKNKF